MGNDAGEEWAQLNGADDAEVWVGVSFGQENKVSLKLPTIGEFEINPHEIDEWLQSHGLKPTQSQRSQLDNLVNNAIERGRARAFGVGDRPQQDTELLGLWQAFQQAVQALHSAAGGTDRAAIFQSLAQALSAMDAIETSSLGGRSCADEVSGWWQFYSNANEWDLASAQEAGRRVAAAGDAAAGWAVIQLDLRNAQVIMQQHLFMDISASWRQAMQPVQTWATNESG